MISAGACKKYSELLKAQIKLSLLHNTITAVLFTALTPLIFGIKNLDSLASAFVLERFVALSGIILFTPLFLPEQDKSIAELVESKYSSPTGIYLTRLVLSIITLALIISIFIYIMLLYSCEFNTAIFITGTFATAFFLGAVGFTIYGITNNLITGYLSALCCYLLNMFMGSDKLKGLYLFSLSINSFDEKYRLLIKYWLLIVGSALIAFTLLYKYIIIRRR